MPGAKNMQVELLTSKRKRYAERSVSSLSPLVWILVSINTQLRFISVELGVCMAIFYAGTCAVFWYEQATLLWNSTFFSLLDAATTFCVAWCSIWFVDGFEGMPVAAFYGLFVASLLSHATLEGLYRRRVVRLARECYSDVERCTPDGDMPPAV